LFAILEPLCCGHCLVFMSDLSARDREMVVRFEKESNQLKNRGDIQLTWVK